jgi:hypothetical protein
LIVVTALMPQHLLCLWDDIPYCQEITWIIHSDNTFVDFAFIAETRHLSDVSHKIFFKEGMLIC